MAVSRRSVFIVELLAGTVILLMCMHLLGKMRFSVNVAGWCALAILSGSYLVAVLWIDWLFKKERFDKSHSRIIPLFLLGASLAGFAVIYAANQNIINNDRSIAVDNSKAMIAETTAAFEQSGMKPLPKTVLVMFLNEYLQAVRGISPKLCIPYFQNTICDDWVHDAKNTASHLLVNYKNRYKAALEVQDAFGLLQIEPKNYYTRIDSDGNNPFIKKKINDDDNKSRVQHATLRITISTGALIVMREVDDGWTVDSWGCPLTEIEVLRKHVMME